MLYYGDEAIFGKNFYKQPVGAGVNSRLGRSFFVHVLTTPIRSLRVLTVRALGI
jgi:hypothetical protein